VGECGTCSCNPSYSGGRDQENEGLTLAQVKSRQDPILTNKLGVMALTCHPSYTGGINRGIVVHVKPGKKWEILFEKIN
jgi:hypothetical protein